MSWMMVWKLVQATQYLESVMAWKRRTMEQPPLCVVSVVSLQVVGRLMGDELVQHHEPQVGVTPVQVWPLQCSG